MTSPSDTGVAPTFLDGLLVVEMGARVGVGACGQLMARLGASVVAVEPVAERQDGKWANRSSMMAGKESVVFDVARDADAAAYRALLARADVVLLSTDDGTSDAAMWDASRPKSQIVCDITAFGHSGPLAGRGASEAIVAALTGVADTTGPASGAPALVGSPVLEMSTAVFAASAVVAALRVRRRHGFGQRIDIAMFDTAINQLVNFLPLEFEGQHATRSGNRHPLHRPWGSYRTRDGHVLICAATNEHFVRLFNAIGRPDIAGDERLRTSQGRLHKSDELDHAVESWTRERSTRECESTLLRLGVASGAVVAPDQLQAEPNVVHRRSVLLAQDEHGSAVMVPGELLRSVPGAGVAPTRVPARDSGRRFVEEILQGAAALSETVTGDTATGVSPLAGVTVVEIGQYTVAPLAARHMGALGATVVKVEPPSGDATRSSAPFRADGQAHIFALSNTDKRGIVLDLKEAGDRETLERLLKSADVLVENVRPGALAKLGYGSDTLRERYPQLVYCAITGFGHDSAYPGRPALDTVVQAMSGLMSTTVVEGTPTKAGISASDMLGGQFGLLAILAALDLREKTGVAVHFDLSMQDTSIWMTQMAWPHAHRGASAIVCKAADGYVVAEASPEALASALARDASAMTRAAVVERLAAAGIACAPVASVAEAMQSAQVAARGLLVECPTADGSRWTVVGSPLRLLSTPAVVRVAMSRLGAENAAVVRDFGLRTGDSRLPFHQPVSSEAQ